MYERDIKVEWKPIKTAPRDGRWFILWTASSMASIELCRWTPESNRWRVKSLPGLGERLADLLDFNDTIVHRWIELEPFFNSDGWLPHPNGERQ
ncbi:hypothetical protein GA0061099_10655 [Bradyrhizobium yuanmingense]|uniref:Uncharacterized protein n=1 Tax=Bradyrhizobium yuanmingense TaxID=108015 RepID=A0A1C3XMH1_9BRAD|nr:hypothetical protein [Bradyrhizobium yuanmingense]TWI19013.1 hypothetical protein IQ15_07039 [Bradyrhizobium yuanmingense]SCB53450.1 hypothetical protein GA0061099_10655 [Bradyrhizobium yuanmingense]